MFTYSFMTLFHSSLLSSLILANIAWAETAIFTNPSTVIADADGNTNSPWIADGVTPLSLQFDTSGTIPAGSTINSVTIRANGTAISPSYRSEIDLSLSDPAGNTASWDFGTELGFADSPGDWDSGNLTASALSGEAAGTFTLSFSEDYDDTFNSSGHDNNVAAVTLTIDFTAPSSTGANSNPPFANPDEGLTQTGSSVAINAFANDHDVDGDSFSLLQTSTPSNGSISWDGNGVVTYTPNSNFVGNDQFNYQIIDSTGIASQETTVQVVVTAATSSQSISFNNRSDLLADSSSYSGVAMGVVDMNQDGRDDIIRLHNALDLFIDYQNPDGSFTPLSLGTPSNSNQWGLAVGDTDNNGYPDIITGGYLDGLHYQQANSNGTSFSKSTLSSPAIFLQAVSFADINNDGWLDLFPCHDIGINPPFRNAGNGDLVHDPSLIDTTTSPASDNSGNYGVVWTDYDGDGDSDLYISKCRININNRSDPRRINQLFRNNGDGTFTEVAATAGLAVNAQSWTTDFADVDNDGDLDCFIGNHDEASQMMRNNGNGTFTEVTSSSGINVDWDVIQSIFRDFNNDGWVDLLLTGVQQDIWLNDRDGTFTKISNPFTSNPMESAAVGDLNRDGFPDIYAGYARLFNTPQSDKPNQLFLSNKNGNGFLSINLNGRTSNKLASGAVLELHGPWGIQMREVRSGEGYGITNSFSQCFGMGNVALADRLVVRWPSGTVDTAFGVAANQFLTLQEGDTAAPSLNNPGNRSSVTDSAVTLQLNASDPNNNSLTFTASGLPTGLSLNSATGHISGQTATVGGVFNVTVSVSDGWTTVSRDFTWTINEGGNNNGGSGETQTPFGGFATSLPGRIQAEDFDEGPHGEATFDLDPENIGGAYRTSSVDLENSFDSDGTFSIGWIENAEWTEYTVEVIPGNYDIIARISSAETAPGLIRVLLDNRELGFITVTGTDDWDAWENATLQNISITESGPAILRLEYIGGPYNLNWIEFTPNITGGGGSPNTQQSFLEIPPTLPGRIQAENYDHGGQGVSYQDNEPENLTESYRNDAVDIEASNDIDGSFSLSWFDANEWIEYTVDPNPGIYSVTVRTAAGVFNPGDLRVLIDGTELATFDIPDTGDPAAWASTTLTGITIPNGGEQILRVETVGNGINLNWIEFTRTDDLPGSPPTEEGPSEESLLAMAFGSWNGNPEEIEFPRLNIISDGSSPSYSISFLIRLGGWRTQTGYLTQDLRYEPLTSSNLQGWESALRPVANPEGLPVPPAGFKYATYELENESQPKAFFRVNISEP